MTDTSTHWIRAAGALGLGLFLLLGVSETSSAHRHLGYQDGAEIRCSIDLSQPPKMRDILSNALSRGFEMDDEKVVAFLDDPRTTYATGDEFLKAAAKHFSLDEPELRVQVDGFKHVNCYHGPMRGGDNGIRDNLDGNGTDGDGNDWGPVEVSQFSRDVILHVVLHEMGHALVREFDLPILGNEETLAEAFATYYLTSYLPERAEATLLARVTSLMIEAGEVPRAEWTVAGEHNSDARRAFQIAALSVAVDAGKYASVAAAAGMSESDIRRARDYGTEILRSWRRILRPLRMPDGATSKEAWVSYDEAPIFQDLLQDGLADELRLALYGFDWHSQVTITFKVGEGGAGWNRSKRTITVNEEYVRRFIDQGQLAKQQAEELTPKTR